MESELFGFFEKLFSDAQEDVAEPGNITLKIALTIGLVLLWYWTNRLTRSVAERYIKNIKVINWVVRVSGGIFSFIYAAILIRIWLDTQDSLLFVLLFLLTLIVLSGRDLFGNIVGRLILLRKQYFKLYDRIEIDGMKGEVVKINLFSFELMELANWFTSDKPTGRTIRVPNELILNKPIFNYNRMTPVIWAETIFTVTVDSNWGKALEIIMNTAKEIAEPRLLRHFDDEELEEIQQEIKLFDANLEQDDIVSLSKEGVILKAHFPVHYKERTKTKTLVYKDALKRLEVQPDVELLGYAVHLLHEN